ncbi:MAG: ribonuclease Y, partial [Spirochaetota bacterium]
RNAQNMLQEAERDAAQLKKDRLLEVEQLILKEQKRAEKLAENRNRDLQKRENRLERKEDNLESKLEEVQVKEGELDKIKERLIAEEQKLAESNAELVNKLQLVAGMNREEAKRQIIEAMEKEAHQAAYERLQVIEEEARENAELRARDILITTMQRIGTEVAAEQSITTVSLPNEDMKGRIIGKEGRNIRSLETLTGVDIIIDDTPEAVIISCFDPVRRAIAKTTLERLVQDGRIHPVRIEETVNKVSKELNQLMRKEAEKVLYELNIHNMKPEGVRALGRLYFRTSYGQNILYHSCEVAKIAGMIGAELGLDAEICKRGGLMHDIGKGLVDNPDLDHAHAGEELAKRLNEHELVLEAISDHHGDADHSHPELVVVKLADALSASRPGARRESVENYIKRLENLEKIALSYEGIDKVYAVQAGRELRIMANHESVSDMEAKELAKTIAQRIETEMQYPGHIRVTIIRETRAVEYAK